MIYQSVRGIYLNLIPFVIIIPMPLFLLSSSRSNSYNPLPIPNHIILHVFKFSQAVCCWLSPIFAYLFSSGNSYVILAKNMNNLSFNPLPIFPQENVSMNFEFTPIFTNNLTEVGNESAVVDFLVLQLGIIAGLGLSVLPAHKLNLDKLIALHNAWYTPSSQLQSLSRRSRIGILEISRYSWLPLNDNQKCLILQHLTVRHCKSVHKLFFSGYLFFICFYMSGPDWGFKTMIQSQGTKVSELHRSGN